MRAIDLEKIHRLGDDSAAFDCNRRSERALIFVYADIMVENVPGRLHGRIGPWNESNRRLA